MGFFETPQNKTISDQKKKAVVALLSFFFKYTPWNSSLP
tara:strand:+ start:165 stop:281 length:117 start_codon:yes stop_codon:yes gene_type:complete